VENTGTALTIHAPDDMTSLFQPSCYLMDGILRYFQALFQFAEKVKSRLITIHLGAPVIFRTDTLPVINYPEEDSALYREMVTGNLDRFLDLAGGRFVICVENQNLDGYILDILKPYLENQRLALCWDLPKNTPGSAVEQYYFAHLSYVKQVHLSDLGRDEKGSYRRHLVIGTGELDFSRYLDRLKETEVLNYCIEVRPREKARESLEALKRLLTKLG
jgi:hypothetical protein